MRSRIQQHGRMIFISALIACIICLGYFRYLPQGQTAVSLGYLLVATLSQMGLLFALWGLITLPVTFIKPERIRALLTALLFAAPLLALYIDTQVFAQYRYHIQWILVELLLSGGIVEFTTGNILLVIAAAMGSTAVMYLLYQLQAKAKIRRPVNKLFFSGLFICLLATHLTHIWASANAIQSITTQNRFLPLFYPTTANRLLRDLGWADEASLDRQKQLQVKSSSLNYPLAPLQLNKPTKPVNIVVIGVDSWRWDALSAKYAPNIWQFAQQGMRFDNHLSTGNATRAGIFGLYYGMPSTYWHSFYANRRSPVLMDVLQQEDYQLGIFASAQLVKPEFDQTVFVNVPNLRKSSKAEGPVGKDEEITRLWLQWNKHRDLNKPAFSFLFYDAPHAYAFPENYPVKFEPMAKEIDYMALNNDYDASLFKNRYMTAAHFTDSLIGKVLTAIEHSPDRDNTVVIITGDHGQEANDNKLNYWGHNSNFSDAQAKVPMVIVGPGIKSGISELPTSHVDIAPTLLQHYLGLKNPVSDYSTGQDILAPNPKQVPFRMVASYTDYALVSKNSILTVSGKNGGYQLLDRHYRPLTGQPDFAQLQQALQQMRQFLK
ncbi:DUF3413 domain-containing protein [Shewanella sp. NFH-SH190041]|uniref:DUF3413 domain-containing protein n=1 Tax=Shewanella sp. NFH-SH190041 TaxID=2950245 RepID=UPI0021C36C2D|nr:DUF3413 domain-containing protein [Shewanella sp. NFH-SH190041]